MGQKRRPGGRRLRPSCRLRMVDIIGTKMIGRRQKVSKGLVVGYGRAPLGYSYARNTGDVGRRAGRRRGDRARRPAHLQDGQHPLHGRDRPPPERRGRTEPAWGALERLDRRPNDRLHGVHRQPGVRPSATPSRPPLARRPRRRVHLRDGAAARGSRDLGRRAGRPRPPQDGQPPAPLARGRPLLAARDGLLRPRRDRPHPLDARRGSRQRQAPEEQQKRNAAADNGDDSGA
jgi:hypothetical protein